MEAKPAVWASIQRENQCNFGRRREIVLAQFAEEIPVERHPAQEKIEVVEECVVIVPVVGFLTSRRQIYHENSLQ